MMRHYTSLWDARYLPKGIAMLESLKQHSSEPFTVHVLAMDEETADVLRCLYPPREKPPVDVVDLSTFERDAQLSRVRSTRSWLEYLWTLASVFTDYMISEFNYGSICYVDADVYFFADPKTIFDEIGNRSIGITPHRFNERDKIRFKDNGEFNVGIVFFQGPIGKECLARWAQQCRRRCSTAEGCGDQKYLDEFFPNYGQECCVIENLGVNLGPWSIGNFEITERDGYVFVNDDRLVAYHFHEYIHGKQLTGYPLRDVDRRLIYDHYERSISELGRTKQLASIHL